MSRVFKLYRLQQVDSQLDQVNQRLTEINRILGDDDALNAALAALETSKLARLAEEKKLRFAEEEVKTQQIKIEQNQSTLYSGKVTNPKELQDLQAEAEALKRHLADLEDAQLERMELLENGQAAETEAAKRLHKIQADREKEHGDLVKEQSNLLDESARLSSEKSAASSGILEEDMRFYLKTRESKNGLAVAKVKENSCSACGNQLSQALAQAARSPDEINRCSTCKRILYAG